jgi:hypothetical protein
MSVGLLLASPDDAVIWRGPKKNGTQVSFDFVIKFSIITILATL